MALDTQQKRMAAMGHGRPWMRAVYPSGLDAVQRASIGLAYGGNTLASGSIVWTSATASPYRSVVLDSPTGAIYVFRVEMRATAGTARARLYNITGAASVTSSEITTAATINTILESATLTLTDGDRYVPQFGTLAADGGIPVGAEVDLIP